MDRGLSFIRGCGCRVGGVEGTFSVPIPASLTPARALLGGFVSTGAGPGPLIRTWMPRRADSWRWPGASLHLALPTCLQGAQPWEDADPPGGLTLAQWSGPMYRQHQLAVVPFRVPRNPRSSGYKWDLKREGEKTLLEFAAMNQYESGFSQCRKTKTK